MRIWKVEMQHVTVAVYAYYSVMEPRGGRRILSQDDIDDDFESFVEDSNRRRLANPNIARLRRWRALARDSAQDLLDSGSADTEAAACSEYE